MPKSANRDCPMLPNRCDDPCRITEILLVQDLYSGDGESIKAVLTRQIAVLQGGLPLRVGREPGRVRPLCLLGKGSRGLLASTEQLQSAIGLRPPLGRAKEGHGHRWIA